MTMPMMQEMKMMMLIMKNEKNDEKYDERTKKILNKEKNLKIKDRYHIGILTV